jgi:chromosome segregation ATPase
MNKPNQKDFSGADKLKQPTQNRNSFGTGKYSFEHKKVPQEYSYYSKVLKQPFDTVDELKKAEDKYRAEQRAKEDKANQKKADAAKVDAAFKALNDARRTYKEELTQLTKEYAETLEHTKKAFELGKKDIQNKLASAEEAYSSELKAFTDKYENYHMTLKDSDFETTISKQTSGEIDKNSTARVFDLFDILFGL